MDVTSKRGAGSPGLVLALTSVAFFMVSLDALVVVTALPAIHQSIGGAIGTLEWAVNGYGLTFAAGIITAAALGERLGRRRVYVAGLTVFTLASAACAVAPNAGLLIVPCHCPAPARGPEPCALLRREWRRAHGAGRTARCRVLPS